MVQKACKCCESAVNTKPQFLCDCLVKSASNGSMCRSAECLVNGGSVNVLQTVESHAKHPHLVHFQANKSLSTSLPDLASPSDEYGGLSG